MTRPSESGAWRDLGADLLFALRALRRRPGFALATVAVLAVGIGAATAVFMVVETVLLSALPYPHAERLVRVHLERSPTQWGTLSAVDVQAIAAQQRSFDAFAAVRGAAVALSGAGRPEQAVAGRVTAEFFAALSVWPESGRAFRPEDEADSSPPVVVLSHALASRTFGDVEQAPGKTLAIDGVDHGVVGVLAPGVRELAGIRADVWPILRLATPTRRGPFGMRGIGRLREGVTLESARQDLAGISERIFPLWESGFKDRVAKFVPHPLRDTIVGWAEARLGLFAGAVALVLLVAIANVATLVLVRTAARGQEFGMRSTLGASRGRLARLVAAESLVHTGLVAALAFLVALAGLRLVTAVSPNLPRAHEIGLSGPGVLFLLAASLVSGALVAVSPLVTVLGHGTPGATADNRRAGTSRRTSRLRGALVAAEFALALPLLLGAGLLFNSFVRLQNVDPGFDTTSTLSLPISLPAARYPENADVLAFWRRAVQRALETPGVVAAGLATAAPPDTQGDVNNFNLVDHPVPDGAAEPLSPWSWATSGFFEALGVPLLEGRLFLDTDVGDGAPVVVVSRSWAAHYFPRGENPIGRQLIEGGCYDCPRTTIVGIVGDVKYNGLTGDGDGVYAPITQNPSRSARLFVRTAGSPAAFVRPLEAALAALDPELPLAARPLSERLRDALADPGRWTAVLGTFGAAALLLAVLGIFGLMSYVVQQERREIGIRLALGADPAGVTRLIVRRGMRHVLVGTAAGLLLALLEARWLGALLFDVSAHDPLTLTAAIALLLIAALLACVLPGYRAARIHPAEALAAE